MRLVSGFVLFCTMFIFHPTDGTNLTTKEMIQELRDEANIKFNELMKKMDEQKKEIEYLKRSSEMCSSSDQMNTLQTLMATDECETQTHNCSRHATCTDKTFYFQCSCLKGYSGDGYTCEDLNECADDPTICPENERCVNVGGSYKCDLDVPNPPVLQRVVCNGRDVLVEWQPMGGDNRAPILGYIIQFNTSFTPDTWGNAFDAVPATGTQFYINLTPWANYTFRVIARNKIGLSLPSDHSEMCTTPQDVPYTNPDGVEGKGSTPQNLVIKWSPMPEIDHNGPGFKYRVYYKREDVENAQWEAREVVDWEQDHFVVPNQPTFKPYRIKVEAHNDKGQAHVSAPEIQGWSGEDVPMEAPTNLTLVDLKDATTALLAWNPVSSTSVRGHFKGYKIQTWTENESEEEARDIIVENNQEPRALVTSFVPFTKNFVRVLVFSGAYDGPPSELLNFVTPQGRPGPVNSLDAIPMGSSAFFLIWRKPKHPNGILTGYHIYYQEVHGIHTGVTSERDPPIRDAMVTRAKLASLKPATKYRITIRASTQIGEGSPYYIERMTRTIGAIRPGKPTFIWQHINTNTGVPAIKITWIPNTETSPGSHFNVKYKLYGESMYQETKPELYEDFTVLKGLEAGKTYQVCVVAVDGEYITESDVEEIAIGTMGP